MTWSQPKDYNISHFDAELIPEVKIIYLLILQPVLKFLKFNLIFIGYKYLYSILSLPETFLLDSLLEEFKNEKEIKRVFSGEFSQEEQAKISGKNKLEY